MFDNPFKFRKINHQRRENLIEHNYSFKGKGGDRYIAVVEQYENEFYVPKFYLAQFKFCEYKYNRLSGLFESNRVICTMVYIMKDILSSSPYASFGFIGSESIGERKTDNTKRFRIYKMAIGFIISPVYFEHKEYPLISAYLLINRDKSPEYLDQISEMINSIYDNTFRNIQPTS